MSDAKPYLVYLSGSANLITTYEATRAGFVTAALEKNKLANPFVDEARTLKVKASKVSRPQDLLTVSDIQSGLLTAAGISDKATAHLREEDYNLIIDEFIKNFLEPAGDKFAEELVYRFLLIRGDTLGGKIRNLAGVWAQRRLTRYILSDMVISGKPYYWLNGEDNKWRSHAENIDIENLRGFSWQNQNVSRVLIYNVKVPIVKNEEENDKAGKGKGVDICLFNCELGEICDNKLTLKSNLAKKVYSSAKHYIALGELKGGIDPAGADEHWKTANSALSRIRKSFERLNLSPHIFFIGSAIEESMADEIWGLLSSNQMANAANLNDEKQMVSLASWLCSL